MKDWKGELNKADGIKLVDNALNLNNDGWDYLVEDFYDEISDTMPNIYHIMISLGITKQEYEDATGCVATNWPVQ